jgi:hypothetical protein
VDDQDDMLPAPDPIPRPDPKHVALGFSLEIHRGDGRGPTGNGTINDILGDADRIHQWISTPGSWSGSGYVPDWALHTQRMIQQVLNKLGAEVATLADIQNTVNELVATDGTIVTALDDLKTKVDAGGTVTSADLDAVNTTIQGELTKLQDAVNRDDPPAPAPAPVTGP